jgi:hypothetical protein
MSTQNLLDSFTNAESIILSFELHLFLKVLFKFLILQFLIIFKSTAFILISIKTFAGRSLFDTTHLTDFLANFKLIIAQDQAHQKAFMTA